MSHTISVFEWPEYNEQYRIIIVFIRHDIILLQNPVFLLS